MSNDAIVRSTPSHDALAVKKQNNQLWQQSLYLFMAFPAHKCTAWPISFLESRSALFSVSQVSSRNRTAFFISSFTLYHIVPDLHVLDIRQNISQSIKLLDVIQNVCNSMSRDEKNTFKLLLLFLLIWGDGQESAAWVFIAHVISPKAFPS